MYMLPTGGRRREGVVEGEEVMEERGGRGGGRKKAVEGGEEVVEETGSREGERR